MLLFSLHTYTHSYQGADLPFSPLSGSNVPECGSGWPKLLVIVHINGLNFLSLQLDFSGIIQSSLILIWPWYLLCSMRVTITALICINLTLCKTAICCGYFPHLPPHMWQYDHELCLTSTRPQVIHLLPVPFFLVWTLIHIMFYNFNFLKFPKLSLMSFLCMVYNWTNLVEQRKRRPADGNDLRTHIWLIFILSSLFILTHTQTHTEIKIKIKCLYFSLIWCIFLI